MPLNIAIDGPVGAGKSSIADAVAGRLGILHLDTGAMYRAIGYQALFMNVNPDDEGAVRRLLDITSITVAYAERRQRTMVNGVDVTDFIRTPEVSMAASSVSRWADVRKHMVALQRRLAASMPMLLDGRDIGTCVLPDAKVKIYLTASPEVRARRRYDEMVQKGEKADFNEVLADLNRRDYQDTHRQVDPLRPAEDAVRLDTSDMTFDQVVDRIVAIAGEEQ